MSLKGKNILLGVTGGIAAYKAANLTRLLVKDGASVKVVMTPAAKQFVAPLTFATLSQNPVLTEFFNPENGEWHSHVKLGVWADAMIVAPATANTIAKMANGIADNMLPIAGYSSDGSSVSMSHLCSIVKISVKRETTEAAEVRSGEVDADNIACIRFKGRNNEKVSGSFEIAYDTPALAAAEGTGTGLEVRVSKNRATSTETAIDYYLVVPAREYANGFDIIVQDASGHIMTKSKASSWTPVAGKLYNMPEFAFVPTGTELGVEISNADEFVAFAQAYNAENYKALGSQLMATLSDDISFDETSSAAFNATGGIGSVSADNYFNGVFNGNDHSISGLVATVPLFANTGGGGTIKNLTVDNTCSFTFTHPNDSEGNYGAIAGYHKGTLDNVKAAADVSLAAVSDVAQMTSITAKSAVTIRWISLSC